MRIPKTLLASVALTTLLAAGCAGPEKKLGRGLVNVTEFARGGELTRSVEQTALWYGPETSYTTGVIRGLNKSIVRTFVGLYEVITFPIPSYDPVLTHYITPEPVFPDNYRPNWLADQVYATDTSLGFSGGDIFPAWGSRFRIFDN